MHKPVHQWQTRLHHAVRRADPPGGRWADDSRAEAFELRFEGRIGEAICGLHEQRADVDSLRDPDLEHAISAWLLARGVRRVDLRTGDGAVVRAGPISLADVSDRGGPFPRRIVTLAPSIAELVGALGCFDRVVACEDSSDHPPEVVDRERLGPDLDPDLERVAALRPDRVLSSLTVPGMERIVTGLRARGLAQTVLAARSVDDVLDEVSQVGTELGVPERAAIVRARMVIERARLESDLDEVGEPVPVYLEWWPRPMFTPGRDCFSNELIRLAGGRNVFGDRVGSSVEVTPSELVEASPEVCFVSWCGVAERKLDPGRVLTRSGVEGVPCVRSGQVYPLDEAFAGRPGPRMLEASRRMAAVLRAAQSTRAARAEVKR